MTKQNLATGALVAGAVALTFGIWGFVERAASGDDEAAIEETMMWIALSIIVLAVASILNALSNRRP